MIENPNAAVNLDLFLVYTAVYDVVYTVKTKVHIFMKTIYRLHYCQNIVMQLVETFKPLKVFIMLIISSLLPTPLARKLSRLSLTCSSPVFGNFPRRKNLEVSRPGTWSIFYGPTLTYKWE